MTKVPDQVVPAMYTPKVAVDPVAAVKSAHFALKQANDDFERLAIRDSARAAQAAAKILGLRDIQVQASEIVARAERAIVIANPPKPSDGQLAAARSRKASGFPPEQTRDSNSNVSTEIPASMLSKMRQAHSMPDTKFEAVVQAARVKQQPLTRRSLQREAAKDAPDRVAAHINGRRPSAPDASAPPVDPVMVDAMQGRIASLLVEVSNLEADNADKNEQVEFYRQQQYPDAAAREQLLNNQRAQITTLKSQVHEWQTKFEDQRKETAAIRRQLKKTGLT